MRKIQSVLLFLMTGMDTNQHRSSLIESAPLISIITWQAVLA